MDASKLVCFIMITTLPGLYLSCAWTKTPLFPTTVSLQRQYLKTNLFRSRFSSKNIQKICQVYITVRKLMIPECRSESKSNTSSWILLTSSSKELHATFTLIKLPLNVILNAISRDRRFHGKGVSFDLTKKSVV